jgi:nicotinate dehydrogenase subunit B
LFLRERQFVPDPAQSAEWNRGAYLVEGLGHCGACHSPRNILGAEKSGSLQYAGGFADGWEVPPLTASSHSPIPWSEADLFEYLRTGATRFHGAAAGPMQAVVASLAQLPDGDIRAMAHYLASFNPRLPEAAQQEMAAILEANSLNASKRAHEAGARLFEGACASCHDPQYGSLAGARPSLALNTNLHSAAPTNAIRALLDGVNVPTLAHRGAMPSFSSSFDDRQIADLLGYVRARFAPDRPAWSGLSGTVARLRESELKARGGRIAESWSR